MASPVVVSTIIMLIYILAIPATISLIFGTYIMNYLKGDSNSNSLLYAGIFDIANFIGFFQRFVVQFIRYVLIFIKISLFNFFVDHVFEHARLLSILDERVQFDKWCITRAVDEVFILIRESIHALFELTNIFIIYYAQLGAFVIVLFWLLKALHSSAWPIVKYKWFNNKR